MASELETRMTEHEALVRHFHEGVPGVECSHVPRKTPYCIVEADAILASDWLRERDRRIRSVVGKEIAEAIESRYLGPDSGRLPDGRDAPDAAQRNAYDEGLELAARIAHRASREIGGGA